ncbi:hypothetical protein EDI36_13575 [Listeria monocytogenes]|nr:hypothetical protein [Listeria monocytogenes]
MKKYLSMVKRWDIIIILSLCILSFLPIAIFSYVKANEPAPANGKKELVAVISVDSKEYKTVTLTGHKGTESFDVKQPDGHTNTIEVSGEEIRINKANCNDQVCVRTGAIDKQGDTVVCLPHKLVIEVKASDGSSGDSDDPIISS